MESRPANINLTELSLNFSRSGPVTSRIAGEKITRTGRRQSQSMIVLRALVQHPGTTSAELAARLNLDRVMVARRLPDLEALGYVSREGINRKPAVGGAGVMWKPTPEGIAAWSRARGSA